MSDERIQGYARGLFELARAEGTLDEVEDELFRFARSYESNDELRLALAEGRDFRAWVAGWEEDERRFLDEREGALLYG